MPKRRAAVGIALDAECGVEASILQTYIQPSGSGEK
jgi:hypothetical protein